MSVKKVVIHTDGGCHGNPGPGGWAAVLVCGGHRRELSGAEPMTTNNRMELRAAIEALEALKERCRVEIHTDSSYVRNGITEWLAGWKRNGWKTRAKEPVKNEDLWRALDAAAARHDVQWHWLKGHAGHTENERCDGLASAAIRNLRRAGNPNPPAPAPAKEPVRTKPVRTDPGRLGPLFHELRRQAGLDRGPGEGAGCSPG